MMPVRLSDMVCQLGQKCTLLAPEMFQEAVLPALADDVSFISSNPIAKIPSRFNFIFALYFVL